MTYYFINANVIERPMKREFMSHLISNEFGSGPVSSMREIEEDVDYIGCRTTFGIECDDNYIKDKFKSIVGTTNTVVIHPEFHVRSVTKELYKSLFPEKIILPEFVYFSVKVNNKNIEEKVAEIRLHFGSFVVSSLKCTLNQHNSVDGVVLECNSNYISDKSREIIVKGEGSVVRTDFNRNGRETYLHIRTCSPSLFTDNISYNEYMTQLYKGKENTTNDIENDNITAIEKSMEEQIKKLKLTLKMKEMQKEIDELNAALAN